MKLKTRPARDFTTPTDRETIDARDMNAKQRATDRAFIAGFEAAIDKISEKFEGRQQNFKSAIDEVDLTYRVMAILYEMVRTVGEEEVSLMEEDLNEFVETLKVKPLKNSDNV